MKKTLLIIALTAVSCGLFKGSIAKVGNEKIATDLFQHRLQQAALQYDPVPLKQAARAQALKTAILNQLIDDTLLLQEAQRRGITLTDEQLAEALTTYKSQYTEKAFQDMLASRHLSYEDWKEDRRRILIIEQLRDALDPSKITDAEIKEYYDRNKSEFSRGDEVRARQILVEKEGTTTMLIERLKNGDNFAALAQQYSISPESKNGGDLGFFPKGRFPAVFDNCFTLTVGEISPVIKSEYGYHIFKVTDRRAAQTIPLANAKPQIVERLKTLARETTFDTLLQGLRAKTPIHIDEKALNKTEIPYEDMDHTH